MDSKRPHDTLLTAAISTAIVLAIAALYVVAELLVTPLNTRGSAASYITGVLLICVAGGFLSSLVMYVWIGVREHPGGLLTTPFYRPQLIKHALLFAVTAPGGVISVDRLYHHNHPRWTFFLDPEVNILIRLFYVGILVTSLWFSGTWVATSHADHRLSWRRIIVGCIVFQVFIVGASIALYIIGG